MGSATSGWRQTFQKGTKIIINRVFPECLLPVEEGEACYCGPCAPECYISMLWCYKSCSLYHPKTRNVHPFSLRVMPRDACMKKLPDECQRHKKKQNKKNLRPWIHQKAANELFSMCKRSIKWTGSEYRNSWRSSQSEPRSAISVPWIWPPAVTIIMPYW